MAVQATVEIILHATEDVPKFYTVIETLFGFDEKEISKTLTTGHYGNEITVLHMSAKKHRADKIIQRLPYQKACLIWAILQVRLLRGSQILDCTSG